MADMFHVQVQMEFIIFKRPYISLIIGSRVLTCLNSLQEIVACKSLASLEFDLRPLLQGQVGSSMTYHTKKASYLPSFLLNVEQNNLKEIIAFESFESVKFDL